MVIDVPIYYDISTGVHVIPVQVSVSWGGGVITVLGLLHLSPISLCLFIDPQAGHTQARLKKNSVSGVAPGRVKKVRQKTFFSSKIDNIFLPNKKKSKKKKIKMRPPDWPHSRPPATPETEFFLGWPHREIPDLHVGSYHYPTMSL